jgi:hypothetical protein
MFHKDYEKRLLHLCNRKAVPGSVVGMSVSAKSPASSGAPGWSGVTPPAMLTPTEVASKAF